MKRIGLMIAVEIDSVLKSDFTLIEKTNVGKFDVYKYIYENTELYAIHSGAGQTLASAATEILISIFKVDMIINFGVVGSLRDSISVKNVCMVDSIIDYQYDTSEMDNWEVGRHTKDMDVYMKTDESLKSVVRKLYPGMQEVICASGNKFVGTREEKMHLAETFNADIVEMEAASVELISRMHGIKTLYIKGISDSLSGGQDEFFRMLVESSDACFNIIKRVVVELNK